MNRPEIRCDQRARDMAEVFLADMRVDKSSDEYEQYVQSLSQTIQDAVEEWFAAFVVRWPPR